MSPHHSVLRFGIVFTMVVFLAAFAAHAQVSLTAKAPAEPCCTIVAINPSTSLITAKVVANGKTFVFKIGRVGPIDGFAAKSGFGLADGFQRVDGIGRIDGFFQPVYRAGPVDGAGPVDAAKLLNTLRVGQKVWANMLGEVSLDGAAPCCNIALPPNIH